MGKFRKRLKRLGRNLGKTLRYAAPVVGGIVAGPAGAAVGGATGATAGVILQGGTRKQKLKRFKRSVIYGTAATAGFGALAYAGGTSPSAPALTALKNIFGGKGTSAPGQAPPQSPQLETSTGTQPNKPGFFEEGGAFGTTAKTLGDLYLEQLGRQEGEGSGERPSAPEGTGEEGFGAPSGQPGPNNTSSRGPGYELEDYFGGGEPTPRPQTGSLMPLAIAAGLALLVLK